MAEEPDDVVRRDVAAMLRDVAGRAVDFRLEALPRHASSRRHYRATLGPDRGALPATIVATALGADPFRSDEITGAGPRPTELPFLAVHRVLEAGGVRVPRLWGHDVARRLLLVEDLGDRTLRDRLESLSGEARSAAYARAVDLLANLQRETRGASPRGLPFDRRFDRGLLRRELEHFRAWGLEAAWGVEHAPTGPLTAALDGLADTVAAVPTALVHRDFNSRNLMWTEDDELVVIDFQDALVGPATYDLASILCDSYATLDEGAIERLIGRFAAGVGASDGPSFREGFWACVAQRKLKDAGRFVFIDRVRGNPSFLRWYAPSLVHVARALRRVPSHAGLADALADSIPGFPDAIATPTARTGSGVPVFAHDPE